MPLVIVGPIVADGPRSVYVDIDGLSTDERVITKALVYDVPCLGIDPTSCLAIPRGTTANMVIPQEVWIQRLLLVPFAGPLAAYTLSLTVDAADPTAPAPPGTKWRVDATSGRRFALEVFTAALQTSNPLLAPVYADIPLGWLAIGERIELCADVVPGTTYRGPLRDNRPAMFETWRRLGTEFDYAAELRRCTHTTWKATVGASPFRTLPQLTFGPMTPTQAAGVAAACPLGLLDIEDTPPRPTLNSDRAFDCTCCKGCIDIATAMGIADNSLTDDFTHLRYTFESDGRLPAAEIAAFALQAASVSAANIMKVGGAF